MKGMGKLWEEKLSGYTQNLYHYLLITKHQANIKEQVMLSMKINKITIQPFQVPYAPLLQTLQVLLQGLFQLNLHINSMMWRLGIKTYI